jgi:hypothetical protein
MEACSMMTETAMRREDERQMKAFASTERSARIVYLDAAAAGLIAPPLHREGRLVDGGRGRFALATKNKDGRWGISPSAIAEVSEVPAVGKIPLELREHEIIHGKIAYRKARFGNAIITTAIN